MSLSSSTYDEKNVELSTIIVDATYNYILGNITAEGFQKEVEKWRASGGDQIIKEYGEAELGIEK